MFSRPAKWIQLTVSSPPKRRAQFGPSALNRRLSVEPLESRMMLSADSLTWATAPDLTISFAPDGTEVAGLASSLFAEFETSPTAAWQQTVVRAFETWTQYTPANVAVVPDSGDPLGTPGPAIGDTRFGDVRVAAIPLAADVIAMSVPRSEIISGTWAGDILINANYDFATLDELLAVAVHEAGHVLGLGHSDNPNSPMHIHGISDLITPLAEDIALLRRTFGFAHSDGYGEGEERESDERDEREEYEQKTESDDDREDDHYDKYEYDHDRNSETSDAQTTPYETEDGRSQQPTERAERQVQVVYPNAEQQLLYTASGYIESGQQTNVFRLMPGETEDESLEVLTVTVRSDQQGGLIPHAAIYSREGKVLESEVLANADGTLVLQVTNVNPRESYFVHVMAADVEADFQTGSFHLEAQYVQQRTVLDEFFADTLTPGSQAAQNTLRVEETTMAQFVLTVDAINANGPMAMWTTIYDTAGKMVSRITAPAGEARSSGTLLLFPGDYRVEFTAARPDGLAMPDIPFKLSGKTISLPIGPTISDPTRAPIMPIGNTSNSQGQWNPPDLAVTDPVILPPPELTYRPSPPVVANSPWHGSGWWYWQNSRLVGANINRRW